MFRFQVEDSGGGVTAARTTVTVTEVTRTGIANRDANLRSPEECTGAGRRDEFDFLGTVGPVSYCSPHHRMLFNYRGGYLLKGGIGV